MLMEAIYPIRLQFPKKNNYLKIKKIIYIKKKSQLVMKAALYKDIKKVETGEIKKPEIKDKEALIKVKYAGICGTDIHIYKGLHPRATAPLVMSHEFSGIVEEIGTKRKDIKMGDRVVINPLISWEIAFLVEKDIRIFVQT